MYQILLHEYWNVNIVGKAFKKETNQFSYHLLSTCTYIEITLSFFLYKEWIMHVYVKYKDYPNHQQSIGSTCTLCECVEREHLFHTLNVMPCNLMKGLFLVLFPPCYNVPVHVLVCWRVFSAIDCTELLGFFKIIIEATY